jgi:hypothetical protein
MEIGRIGATSLSHLRYVAASLERISSKRQI